MDSEIPYIEFDSMYFITHSPFTSKTSSVHLSILAEPSLTGFLLNYALQTEAQLSLSLRLGFELQL